MPKVSPAGRVRHPVQGLSAPAQPPKIQSSLDPIWTVQHQGYFIGSLFKQMDQPTTERQAASGGQPAGQNALPIQRGWWPIAGMILIGFAFLVPPMSCFYADVTGLPHGGYNSWAMDGPFGIVAVVLLWKAFRAIQRNIQTPALAHQPAATPTPRPTRPH